MESKCKEHKVERNFNWSKINDEIEWSQGCDWVLFFKEILYVCYRNNTGYAEVYKLLIPGNYWIWIIKETVAMNDKDDDIRKKFFC